VSPPPTRSLSSRLREWVGVGVLFAVLTTVVLWPLPARWLTDANEHHDTLFNMWRLSWIAEALTTRPSALFDPPIFHPASRVLAYSDAVLLQGLVATPWLAAGAPLLPVANALLLLGPWMSAMAMYLLVRDLIAHDGPLGERALPAPPRRATTPMVCWPAVIAGTIFGLLPYRVAHIMHLELQWSQWMPLACWALHRTVRHGRVRDGVLTSVFVLAQFLSSIYYGLFLVITLGVTAPLLLLARTRAPLTAIARALVVGGAIGALPLLAYSAPYRANQQVLGGRGAAEIDTWSATPASFVAAPHENRLYGRTSIYGGSETRLWPGALAIVLGFVGLWASRREAAAWMYGAALLLSALLALGTHTPAYRIVLATLPIMNGLRAPARFGMVVALALAVLAGMGTARVLARLPRGPWRQALGALLLAGVVAEYASAVGPLRPWAQRVPMYAGWLRTQPGGTVIDLPIARAGALPLHEAEWSFLGRTHGHPLANGYSGYYPRPYLDLLEAMEAFPGGESVAALRARDVRYIVLHEDRFPPADFLDLDARLRATPGLRVVGRFPDPDYPVTIFTVERR